MMRGFVFGTFFQIIALVSSESIFLQDFIPHGLYPSHSNVITCNEHESINLIKMLSARFQRFVAVHSIDKALTPVLYEPQSFIVDLQCPEATTVLRQFSAEEITLLGEPLSIKLEPIYHFLWLEATRVNGEYADDLNLFRKPFQWLLLGEGVIENVAYKGENISESGENWSWPFLETLSMLTDSDVEVAEKSSDGKITVTGAYKIGKIFLKEPLAEWTPNESLIVLNSKSIPTRRWNLQGVVLRAATIITDNETLNHLEDLVDKNVDTTAKVAYNIVNLFGDFLNASLTYNIGREWGVLVNGSWTGMVGHVQRKEIELTAAPLFFQKSRMHFTEYYASINPTRFKFLFLSPPLSYSSNIFAMPFDTIVWNCCFAMVGISCFLLFTALRHENSLSNVIDGKAKNENSKTSFSEILVLNIGAICLQGTVAQTKNPPGRIITLFLYLSYMFLYISYSACIVAILQSSDTSIQTLADFLKSSLKAGADDAAYSVTYFKITEGEVQRAIYNKKIAPKGEPPHFLSVEDGIKEVRKGFYGFHVETTVGYQEIQKTFTEEEKCGLQELKESFFQFPAPWLVMAKGTPYAEHFKIGMKMLIERGFKSRFVRRYYTRKPECTAKASRFVSVGIIDSYYAFMLLLGGLITSFFILLCEITFKRYIKEREKRTRLNSKYFTPGIEYID